MIVSVEGRGSKKGTLGGIGQKWNYFGSAVLKKDRMMKFKFRPSVFCVHAGGGNGEDVPCSICWNRGAVPTQKHRAMWMDKVDGWSEECWSERDGQKEPCNIIIYVFLARKLLQILVCVGLIPYEEDEKIVMGGNSTAVEEWIGNVGGGPLEGRNAGRGANKIQ